MPGSAPPLPVSDLAIGIGFYGSSSPGAAGRLKASPDAFRVREVSSYPRPDPDGPFTILRLESRDWEQHELAAAIERRLGLAPRAVAWSGTKDRRAVSERLFAYRGAPPTAELGLPRVTVLDAYAARDGLVLGQHYANAFEIRVDDLEAPAAAVAAYRRIERELRDAGGFPNFFGAQRFGEVRPITHDVGRWLVRGAPERAVDAYLVSRPPTGTEGVGDAARAAFGAHRDPARALREFPREYRFELAILERLARGDPPSRALRALPFELRRLFVHAYQAFLFNRYLSDRHQAGLPLGRPIVGDAILRVGRDGTLRGKDAVPVDEGNLAECEEIVSRARAAVAGPLVGTAAYPRSGAPAELLGRILRDEGIGPEAFAVPVAPELASEGTWRALQVAVPPTELRVDDAGVWFRFSLPKGAYATVYLREFLKSGRAGAAVAAAGAEPTNT